MTYPKIKKENLERKKKYSVLLLQQIIRHLNLRNYANQEMPIKNNCWKSRS